MYLRKFFTPSKPHLFPSHTLRKLNDRLVDAAGKPGVPKENREAHAASSQLLITVLESRTLQNTHF
ncbi:hypothetical protein [Hymenobacter koreensis]|uniref:Four helix bundle protein n=1 Tax=Hymenobacter koreensis TaxID=1084523 RepID=A0ABP8JJX1_9BACT